MEANSTVYIAAFISAVLLTAFFVYAVMRVARRAGIVDSPDFERKRHSSPTPLLGGLGIFAAFFILVFVFRDHLVARGLDVNHWFGFFFGACFLMIGGFLDDKFDLKPSRQFIWPVLAAFCVVLGGVNIEKITNPFGGTIDFSFVHFDLDLGFYLVGINIVSALVITLWLLGMMYTTKFLDGVDGLVTGVSTIGAVIIFLFTITTKYYQPDVGLAALILAGCLAVFLIFNWHPARIFLGEGGSLFLGFALGVLAIISGGKIAIALLVMGLPILDVAWTIIQRLRSGNSLTRADRKHLHFRILDLGVSPKKTVGVYYLFAAIFGFSALFLQSRGKLISLLVLVGLMFVFVAVINRFHRKAQKTNGGQK